MLVTEWLCLQRCMLKFFDDFLWWIKSNSIDARILSAKSQQRWMLKFSGDFRYIFGSEVYNKLLLVGYWVSLGDKTEGMFIKFHPERIKTWFLHGGLQVSITIASDQPVLKNLWESSGQKPNVVTGEFFDYFEIFPIPLLLKCLVHNHL